MVNNTERYQSSDFNSYFCIPWWYWYTLYIKIVQWLPISLWKLHYHPFVIILRACVVAAWLILLACSLLRSSDGSGVSSDLHSFTPFLRTNPFSESANTAKFSGLTIFQINNQFTWYIVCDTHFPSNLIQLLIVQFHCFFLTDCFVWFGEESVITFICHQRAGKNRGKKPLVTLVTNWAFLIKTETKQKSLKQSNRKLKLMLR